MRKFLIMLLLGCSAVMYGQPDGQALLREFVNSADYAHFISRSQFATNGTLDLAASTVKFQQAPEMNGQFIPILFLHFTVNEAGVSKMVGQLQAVRVKEDYNRLPNNGKYLLLYRDYRGFNYATGTGSVQVYDLNYDEYMAGTCSILNGVLQDHETYPLPPVIARKYGIDPEKTHYCDENQNGNVTFGECFRCLVRACQSDPQCALLCAIANMAIPRGQCHAAMALSCVYISMRY